MSKLDFKEILTNFPQIEPFYETIIHKKVYNSDIIMAIPEGSKSYAWFTTDYLSGNNICYILEVNENDKKVKYISVCKTSFHNSLSYGTIFSGIFINNKKYIKNYNKNQNNIANNFFIENIYFYKGKDVTKDNYLNKLSLLKQIFTKELGQQVLGNEYTIFGLPIMDTNFQNLVYNLEFTNYKVAYLAFKKLDNTSKSNNSLLLKFYKPGSNNKENDNINTNKLKEAVFKVYADIDSDIYKLYTYNQQLGTEEYYNVAYVPDYKTSVFLNSLFRNIKENINLDALEESDDEDEFESEKPDKFVDLNKNYKMNCVFNQKFKRWTPVSVADNTSRIVLKSMV